MVHVIEESFDFRYLSTKIDKAKKKIFYQKITQLVLTVLIAVY